MERCRNLTACGMELLDDPVLKTTAANYDFKYVPGEQFQRVIRTVQRDRLKQKKDSIWSEFCSPKSRRVIRDEEPDTMKYERKSHRKPRNVIKTKTSTIKIISHPMVEPSSDDQQSSSARESYKTYKAPKVRVMTDEEIKNVVESAFKEVMEQSGGTNIVSQLQTDKNTIRMDRVEEIPEEYHKDPTPRLEPTASAKQQISARSSKSTRSKRTPKTVSDEDPISLVSSRSIEPNEALLSNRSFESVDELSIDSAKTQQSIHSYETPKTVENEKCEENSAREVPTLQEQVNPIKSDFPEEKMIIPEINVIPDLTCVEKDELRKFLGVEEFILNPEINLNRFDAQSSSSSEDEEDNTEERNIQPLIHIRQPTPRSASSLKRGKFLGPIKSSQELPMLPPAEFEPQTARKSLQSTSQRTLTPRKTPRVGTTPRSVITPRSGVASRTAMTPRNIERPSAKSAAKPTGAVTSRSTLPQTKNATPIPSPKKVKNIKSHGVLSETRYNEIKNENVLLMSKISGHQQKIVQAIEQIRNSLDDIPEPDGHLDLKRRERRAEEFIARFARNYLYQIGRSMEDIRIIPKEQFLAGTDNDLPTKACSLFGTLSQAIVSYLKHMNSFIIDQNPKKLGTLIEAIIESVKMCVHKTLFNKKDEALLNLLRKAKGLKKFLAEAQERAQEMQLPKQKLKSKSQKTKSGIKPPKQPRQLSMYDTIPASAPTVKHKTHALKATARSKTSIRSIGSRHHESKLKISNSERAVKQKASDQKVQEKETFPHQDITPRPVHSNFKDDVFPIKTPRIDNVNTLIETVRSDDFQDEPIPESSNNLFNDILASVHDGGMARDSRITEREKDINNTVIEALESITKQQVQQILGPLMSNLGTLMSNQAGGAGFDINAILNNLITSQLCGAGGGGGVGPAASGEGTFNRQDQEEFVSSEIEYDTNSPLNTGRMYDNNANYQRELAPQNQQRLHEPQSKAAPAPNTFSAEELNNNDDEAVTSSQQPTFTASSENIFAPGIEDMRTSDSGTRARTRVGTEGYNTMKRVEGGDFGATKSEVETKKVQQLRFERNVQFTLVTDNEENDPYHHTNGDFQKLSDESSLNVNSNTKSKNKYKKIMEDEKNKLRVEKLCQERLCYIEQIAESPLYVNENFTKPWKIVSKIANQIVDDAINEVERSINFGEETFVRDFIQMELET